MLEINKILAQSKGQSVADLYRQYNQDSLKPKTGGIVSSGITVPTEPSPRPLTSEELIYRESFSKSTRGS